MIFERKRPELVVADEISLFDLTSEDWLKMVEAITSTADQKVVWTDKTVDEILADLIEANRSMKQIGVRVFAGRNAYAKIRQHFPEDSALVKVAENAYLEEDMCFAVRNEDIALLGESDMEMSRWASTFFELKRLDYRDSSGPGQPPHHSG